jgi:hypothetical protein
MNKYNFIYNLKTSGSHNETPNSGMEHEYIRENSAVKKYLDPRRMTHSKRTEKNA